MYIKEVGWSLVLHLLTLGLDEPLCSPISVTAYPNILHISVSKNTPRAMINFFDVAMFLATIISIYGGVLALHWAQNWTSQIASSVKSNLAQKHVHVCSRGVSIEVPRYYDQEEYINLHRRLGYQFACKALANYPNHRVVLPSTESTCSVM